MSIRIAINGFGRIGRSVFRVISEQPDMEVVAINDLFSPDALAYLLKYDTVMGVFPEDVGHEEGALIIGDTKIKLCAERNPEDLPWGEMKIDVVVEATGIFRERAQLEKHITAGAKKVLLTVPPKDAIDNMIVMGVNDQDLSADDKIVSNASCTTNCLGPLAKVLNNKFGIKKGIMTTVHAYTNDQRLADVPHSDFRRSRAAAENIIPTTTGAAKAVGKVLPELLGKLDGIAVRVPVADGSIVDLVLELEKDADRDAINAAIAEAAAGPLKGILEYSEVPLVSSDIIGNPHSSIFDSKMTQSNGKRYCRVMSWYDNEWGYSNRCIDLVRKMAS